MPRKRPELNKREKAILRFIEKQIMSQGYPPSVREIGKAVGLSSTATVHGYLAKLEDKGYVERKVDEKNRRKYILKTTKKGDDLAILLINEFNEWEEKVGIGELDDETKHKLIEIARKSEEILE